MSPFSKRLSRVQLVLDTRPSHTPPEPNYQDYLNRKWRNASEAGGAATFSDDRVLRESLLSLLYVQRRRDPRQPGLSNYDMARLLGKPLELVEFHLWYLQAKDWLERLDTGQLAISALGADRVEKSWLCLKKDHLLRAGVVVPEGAEERATIRDTADLVVFPRNTDFK